MRLAGQERRSLLVAGYRPGEGNSSRLYGDASGLLGRQEVGNSGAMIDSYAVSTSQARRSSGVIAGGEELSTLPPSLCVKPL